MTSTELSLTCVAPAGSICKARANRMRRMGRSLRARTVQKMQSCGDRFVTGGGNCTQGQCGVSGLGGGMVLARRLRNGLIMLYGSGGLSASYIFGRGGQGGAQSCLLL